MFCPREWPVHQLLYAVNRGVTMHKKDVPQDDNATLNGARKVVYALDEDGRYTVVPTTGWEVEEIVTGMAVDHYVELAQEALDRVKHGLTSPLEYHMYHCRLNIATLAQSTGLYQWQVKRHFRQPISQLKPKTLRRYAEAMGLDVGRLADAP